MPRDFMPILRHPDFRLPWALVAPHEKQAMRNHGQTLEQLAERGGLGFTEALAIMCDLPWRMVGLDEANAKLWLQERIAEHAAGVATSVEDRARTLYAHSPMAYRGTRPLPWDEAPEATRLEFMERARGQITAAGVATDGGQQ